MKKINNMINKMFNTRKKRNIFAILLLSFIAIVGVTIAYFGSDMSFKNLFKSKPFNTTVYEVFESPNSWTPGTTTPKEVYATNESEVDVMVRVSYTEQWLDADGNELPLEQEGNRAAIINLSNETDWTNSGQYYNYNYTLKPGETTSSFMESVTFNPEITGSYTCTKDENGHDSCVSDGKGYDGATYKLIITVEMMQADGKFYVDPRCYDDDTCIARIDETKYISLETALDAAVDGDTIVMINNTTESVVNTKDVTLDLNGYTVTGAEDVTIQNNGKIKIIGGGSLENDTGTTISNEGTLQLGDDDGTVSQELPEINGTGLGIEQNGIFNFYDGIITAEIAVAGIVTDKPDETMVFVDHIEENNYQEEYLIDTMSSRAVARLNGVLYVNLQDAINTEETKKTDGIIYIIRDAELAYTITVSDTLSNIVIDLDGYNVQTGYTITNNGNLKLIDEGETKGILKPSVTIVNNKTLTIDGVTITETTDANVIENRSALTINNSQLTGAAGYVIYNPKEATAPTLSMNSGTTLKAAKYAIYNYSTEESTISGGNIYGIYNLAPLKITGDANIISTSTNYALYNYGGAAGPIMIEEANITSSKNVAVYNIGTITLNGPTIKNTASGKAAIDGIGTIILNDGRIESAGVGINGGDNTYTSGHLQMNGGTIKTSGHGTKNTNVTMNDGTIESTNYGIYLGKNVYINGGTIISNNGYGVYNDYIIDVKGGTIISKTLAGLYCGYNCNLTIGEDEGKINLSPIMQGGTYGLYIYDGAYVEVYDGIFKGKTDAYTGSIYAMAADTTLKTGTETIDAVEYKTAYLAGMDNFVKVGETEFNSLQKAFDSIETEGTVTLIDNASITSAASIDSGKNVTFDMAGYTLETTQTITNNGTLTIIDSSENKTGRLNGGASSLINNTGILNVNSGTLYNGNSSSWGNVIQSTGSEININGGTIHCEKAGYGLSFGNKTGIANINGGEIISNSASSAIILSQGKMIFNNAKVTSNTLGVSLTSSSANFVMQSGSITSSGSYTINNSGGKFTIENGTIKNTKKAGALLNGSGTSTMNGGLGETTGTGSKILAGTSKSPGKFIMNAGEIKSANTGIEWTIFTINGGKFTAKNTAISSSRDGLVTGGTIVSENSYAISNSNSGYNLTITGGTMISNNSSAVYSSGGILNIGTDDSDVKITSPIFQGGIYGLSIYQNSNVNIYDGIFKGQTSGYEGIIYTMPEFYTMVEGTETIDGVEYKTAYLAELQNFVKVGDVEYNSLQQAFDAIETEGIATLIASASITKEATVPAGKNITLDLAGYTLSSTKQITNEGTFTITDTSVEKTGLLSNSKATLISNTGVFNLNDGTLYNNSNNVNYYTIAASGNTVNINGGKVMREKTNYGIYVKNATVTINGGLIESTVSSDAAIYVNSGQVNMTNGTIKAYNCADVRGGSFVMDGGTIESTGTAVSANGTFTMNNGYIKATTTGVTGKGAFTMNGGTIETTGGSSNAVYSYNTNRGSFTMNDGHIISNGIGVYNRIITMNGGNITSNGIGVSTSYNNSALKGGTIVSKNNYGVYSTLPLTIGTKDDNIVKESPVIQGATYGLYVKSGALSFYDGTIKGKTGAISGAITNIADQSYIYLDYETINEATYECKYLKKVVEYIRNESTLTEYNNLATAISEASNDDTLTIIAEAINYDDITIPAEKIININLNGQSLGTSKTFVNNGTLNIYDSNVNPGTLEIKNTLSLIKNYGTVNINDINLKNVITTSNLLHNYSGSNMNIENVSVNSLGKLYSETNTDWTIINSNIKITKDNAIYGQGALTITGGTISGKDYGVYYSSSNDSLNITGAEISSASAIYNYSSLSTTITNTTLNGIIQSNSSQTMSLDNTIVNGAVANNSTGIIVLKNSSNITSNKSYAVNNNSTGKIDIDDISITVNCSESEIYGISNKSTGTITATGVSLNIIDSQNAQTIFGLYSSGEGTTTLTNSNININGGNTSYGAYTNAGTITLESGSITTNGANEAYGVYVNEGMFVSGVKEGNIVFDNPTITAIGTTGIGVKKINGYFMYYDGKLIGSTNAKPETTTEVEYPYEATLYTDETTGYEYYVLEYLEG